MNCKDFVMWLKGFAQAANTYNITPKQWEDIVQKLNTVDTDDKRVKATRYTLDASDAITYSNTTDPNSEQSVTTTYGRLEDSITYTTR